MFIRLLRSAAPLWLLIASVSSMLPSCSDPLVPNGDITPAIYVFTPGKGAAGSTVIIKGKNFAVTKDQNTVRFNGLPATVVSATPTELTVLVPDNVSSGKITVTIGNLTATSTQEFTVEVLAPVITAIAPETGAEGTEVEITGTNFSAGAKVFFGLAEATQVTVVSPTKITAKAPAGVLTSNLKVVSNGNEALSPTKFYVQPVVASFTPGKARQGEMVTLTGNNFSEVAAENTVRFGTVVIPVADIVEATATSLKVKVPAGVFNDKISVKVKSLEGMSTQSFMILPTVTSYTPASGGSGTLVTLTGSNMATDAEIYLGSVKVTAFEPGRTTDKIEFKVPALATGGKIIIRQAGVDTEFGSFTISNVWQKVTDYSGGNEPRWAVARGITFTYNNKIYYGYGFGDLNALTYSNELAAFDMSTFTKTIIHPNDEAATGRPKPKLISNASYAVLNNKLYMFGGATRQGWDKDIWELDLSTNVYVKKAAVLPDALQGLYASFVINGEIYMYLYNNAAQKSQIYKYDPAADAVTKYMDLTIGNRYDFQVEVIGTKAYLIAGGGGSIPAKSIIELDIVAKTTNTISLPDLKSLDLMSNFIHFSYNGKIYFGGGWCGTCWNINAPEYRDEFYVFDPQTKVLTYLGKLPVVSASGAYALPYGVKSNELYILASDGMYRFTP